MDTIFTDGQLTKAIETMRQKGMTPQRFNDLLGSGIFADICDVNACLDNREAVRAALKLGPAVSDVFRLTVDYGRPLEQMIAAGRYDWTDGSITAGRFPVTGNGIEQFEAKLFHFNRGISSEKAIEAMGNTGWGPAKIEHLLSFGEKHPEEQRQFPIVALGSVAEVGGDRFVPCLRRSDSGRSLSLRWFGDGWGGHCRFLAVRKVSVS